MLELEIRRSIYNFILKYPGIHFREISRRLNISRSTLYYHLKYLEKRGFIIAKPEGKFTLYYIINNVGNDQKKILHLLRQEAPRNIITYLIVVACASREELAKSLEKHPTTISQHLKKLIEMDIIEPAPVSNGVVHLKHGTVKIAERPHIGKETIYRLKDCHSICDALHRYEKKILDKTFCDMLSVYYKNWELGYTRTKRLKTIKDFVEFYEKFFWDVFPNPYYC